MFTVFAETSPILEPNPGLMLWTLITFTLAMFVLYKLAFGRIQEQLDKRRQTIADSVEAAERTRQQAEELLGEYRQQLQSARGEAATIVEQARKAGEELTTRIKAEGEKQRAAAVADTKVQVQAEVARSMAQLKADVAEMTLAATEKVLRGAVDMSGHAQLVEQSIEDLDFDRLQQVGSR